MAFGEAFAIFAVQQRQVPPSRIREVECASDELLPRGACEKVIAANDIGDLLPRIVDNDGELVGRDAEFRPHDEVTRFESWIEGSRAVEFIVHEFNRGLNHEAIVRVPFHNRARPWSRRAQIGRKTRLTVFSVRRARGTANLTAGMIAAKECTAVGERGECVAVGRHVGGLHERLAIPIEAQSREILKRLFPRSALHAADIEVFQAQQHSPTFVASERPSGEKSPRVSNVKGSARCRSEASGARSSHRRSVATHATTARSAPRVHSPRMPATKLTDRDIAEKLQALPEWSQPGEEIQRTYRFKDFVAAMGFVEGVAAHAEREQHHPDILIRYSRVTLSLSTHDAGGITEKDFDFALAADRLAGECGAKALSS